MATPMSSENAPTLLIIDDEPLMTELFRQYMSKRGYRVLTAVGGKEALDILDAEETEVQLVVTDMTMPDMNGLEVAAALAKRDMNLPVLITTGHDAVASEADLPRNVVGVVRKPYQNKVMAERIKEILEAKG